MDCRTAQILLEFARPLTRELDVTEAEALESHLADCPECARRARTLFSIDTGISAAMRDVPVPEGLRERLLAGLSGREPKPIRRRLLLQQLGNLAAAAALLLAIAIGWTQRGDTPDINTGELEWLTNAEIANPVPQLVDDWLRKQGVRVPAPTNFDYRLLAHYHMTELQGQRVPLMVFVRSENGRTYQARVYLLSCNQFNLSPTLTTPASICVVQLMPHPSNPRYGYLVVFTGELEPFLAKDQQPTL